MTRMILTDAQWALIEPHCLGKKSDPGPHRGDGRLFMEAVLWIARTGHRGATCRRVSATGTRSSNASRHWVKRDVFKRIFDAASADPDMEYAMVDGTIVKVHRHGQGAKGGPEAKP